MEQQVDNIEEVETKPLVDWPKAPTIEDLKRDLLDAKPNHDSHKAKVQTWLDNLNGTGSAAVNPPKGSSKIVPKLIRKQAEWRYAALSEPFLSTDDIFNVSPITWEDREAAIQNELVLNHQFNHCIDKVSFIDTYVRTAVDEGTVILRTGWDFEEEEYEAEVPKIEFRFNDALAPMHQQLAQMKAESPSQYETDVPEEIKQAHELTVERQRPVEAVVIGSEKKKLMRTVRNCPTVEVCSYKNVLVDPTCEGDVDKARMIIYSFESSISELKKDGRYKNLDKINIEGNTILGEPDHETGKDTQNFNFADKARKKIVVYEYWGFWDIHGDNILTPIVAAWVGNTLIRMEENPFPDKKLPFVIVPYLPVRSSVYGEPDGALLEDNQKIIGAVTRGMIDLMGKSANAQTGVAKNFLDVTNRRKFDKGMDYEFNPGTDPRVAVYQHQFPEIPASAYNMIQMQNQEAEALTGVKSFHQGVSGQSLGDVAAGVRGALDAASKRELGILRRLSKGLVKVARKFMSMNAEFLDEQEIIRITNDEFITVRRDDLAGNFDLRLTISTAEEDHNKAQELGFMLQTMGPNMDPMLGQIILADIARLRKMPDLAKRIEDYRPQPDPVQQEKVMLEIELLKAQLANEQAQAAERQTQAVLNQAKAGTETVKQGNIQADTDQKTLEFVEQESGTKQERDLQKIGEQARSQAQLKLLERETKREERQFDLVKEYIKTRSKPRK